MSHPPEPLTVGAASTIDACSAQPVAARTDRRRWPLVGLLLVLAAIGLVRWRFLDTPLERDEGEFAYGAQRILAGEVPYVSFYAMKLPGIYVCYAAAFKLFGETARGIHLGLLAVNLASIALMYAIGRKLFDDWAGVAAAAAFGLLTLSPAVQGTQAQAEHFVLLPALIGALLLLYGEGRLWMLFLAGLCFGLALVIKQHGAPFGLAAIAYCALARQWKGALAVLAGYLLPVAATCLIFALLGAWEPFVFWTWTYPRAYVRRMSWQESWENLLQNVQLQLQWLWPLWIVALLGLIGVAVKRDRRLLLLGGLWSGASFAAISAGGLFRGHYFVLNAAALALVFTAAPRLRGLALWGTLALSSVLLGIYLLPKTPDELMQCMYPSFFVESPEIATFLSAHTFATLGWTAANHLLGAGLANRELSRDLPC